jgi:voltage-gated sodium channel
MAETQLLPEPGTKLEKVFLDIDLATTILFTLELLLNIFAHSENKYHEFVTQYNNWFDIFIVAVSLFNAIFAATGNSIPGAKVFRLLRLGRVLRVFTVFEGLQKLVSAIYAALVPVCNAFLMLLIIIAVYAVLGTNFFRKRSPEYFGQFSVSLYTLFQILAEGIAISREIFKEGKTETDVAFYFVSYILMVAIGLLNVVVAVLLDAFQNHVRSLDEKKEKARLLAEERRKVHGCLDPLTKNLCTFEDEADLTSRINDIYSKLDEDESEGLAFEEFQEGVKFLSKNIHLTRDDFDVVTENGKHLGPTGEFNRENFQKMMKGELWRYSRRELANVLSVSGDEQFNSTILMLKIMESSTDRALAEVLRLLRSISDPQHQAAGSASPGTGGDGQGKGWLKEGGGMEGLGEVLHKLSINVEQMSVIIDRQSSNMEQMSSEIDWRLEELEDQMAAIQRMQAIKASSHAPLAACARTSSSPLPRKFEHKGESGWVEKNATYPIRQQIRSFLVAPSSFSLQQVSDFMTPSKKKQQSLNDLVLLRSYETSARPLLEREGRNEGRKGGGDFLSIPSPRYLEHVPPVAEVNGSSSNEYKTENVEDMLNDSNVEQKLIGIKSSLHFHQQNLQVRGGEGPSTHDTCACGMRTCHPLTARVHVNVCE